MFEYRLMLVQIYVIGGEGILEELKLAGFTALGGPVSYLFPMTGFQNNNQNKIRL